jgi:hypothetical protein
MKTLAVSVLLLTTACGVESSTPNPVASGPSVCIMPSTGGFGAPCSGASTDIESWYWIDTTKAGEEAHRCNEAQCPSGATCMVQSDESGQDDGGDLLIGHCQ